MRKTLCPYLPSRPSPREQDYQLAYDALHGDQAAWNTLYLEAFDFVVNAAKRFDEQHFFAACDYADIAGEAFSKCYEHLERYQGLSRFQGWVFGYAKNIMRSRRRAQLTARRNRSLLENMASSQSRHLDPLYLLIRLERDQCLWTAFYQLPLSEQVILYRRVFFNTPPRELAKEFQLTRKQVLQHYESALFKLRWNYLHLYSSPCP